VVPSGWNYGNGVFSRPFVELEKINSHQRYSGWFIRGAVFSILSVLSGLSWQGRGGDEVNLSRHKWSGISIMALPAFNLAGRTFRVKDEFRLFNGFTFLLTLTGHLGAA
jgi:hypothetical protein